MTNLMLDHDTLPKLPEAYLWEMEYTMKGEPILTLKANLADPMFSKYNLKLEMDAIEDTSYEIIAESPTTAKKVNKTAEYLAANLEKKTHSAVKNLLAERIIRKKNFLEKRIAKIQSRFTK